MSFILDSLRKAERDRRAAAVPTLSTVHAPVPGGASGPRFWPWIVGAALLANAAVLAVVLRPAPPRAPVVSPPPVVARPPAPARVVAAAPSVPSAPPIGERATPAPAAPAAPAHAVRTPARSTSAAAPAPAPRAPAVEARPAETPPTAPAPLASAPPAAPSADAAAAFRDAKLRLDALVYSDVAADRMVFINGQKYVEGDRVGEQFKLERITPDGAVLTAGGRRFVLHQ